MNNISLAQFEAQHRRALRGTPPTPSAFELFFTVFLAAFLTPFFFTTFFVIPMMGQITIIFAGTLTCVYLWFRWSLLSLLAVTVGVGSFAMITFATIQSLKPFMEVPLFIFVSLGIPITAIYSIFIGTRIWKLAGGER